MIIVFNFSSKVTLGQVGQCEGNNLHQNCLINYVYITVHY